jgi:VWFA-related protein
MRISRREFLGAVAIAAGAQQRPEFSTTLDVVNVFATARDREGRIVSNLAREDFRLEEDRRAQTIQYFSRENDLPLTVGLLIDVSGSTRPVLGAERDAGRRFLRRIMRLDRDRAFVAQFAGRIDLLQDLTRDADALDRAVEQAGHFDRRARRLEGPPSTGRATAGTLLYDAVWAAANEVLRKQMGRKAVVVLSDGVDVGSESSLAASVEAAQRSDLMVYTILFEGWTASALQPTVGRFPFPAPLPTPRPLPRALRRGPRALAAMAQPTGGLSFEVSEKLGLDAIFARIEEDLRNQYTFGYTPEKRKPGYRRIRLTTRRHGVTLRTRDGYYA